jgi:hypothetical protein
MDTGAASAVEGSGLDAPILLLRFHEIAADPAQIRHRVGVGPFGIREIPRVARIITIERGRIVEDGRHAELIERGGRYATLHRMQAGSVAG